MNISNTYSFFAIENPFSENWLREKFTTELQPLKKIISDNTPSIHIDSLPDKVTNQSLAQRIVPIIEYQRKLVDLSGKIDDMIKNKNYFQKIIIAFSYQLHQMGWKKYSLLALKQELNKLSEDVITSISHLKNQIQINTDQDFSMPNSLLSNNLESIEDFNLIIDYLLRILVNFLLEEIPNQLFIEKETMYLFLAVQSYRVHLSKCISSKTNDSVKKSLSSIQEQLLWVYKHSRKRFFFFKEGIKPHSDYLDFYKQLSLDPSQEPFNINEKNVESVDQEITFNNLVNDLIEKIKKLTSSEPSVVFYGGFQKSHATFIQIKRVNNLYEYTVYNTGLGLYGNHEVESKDDKSFVFPLKVTNLTFEAVANKEFLQKLIFSYLDYSQESLDAVQSSYDLCHNYLVKQNKGTIIKKSGVSYPVQTRASCPYSVINQFAVQTISLAELEKFKKSVASDFIKTTNYEQFFKDMVQQFNTLKPDIELLITGRALVASHYGIPLSHVVN